MGISKVVIEDGCTACGLCEQICPEVFEVKDIAAVKDPLKIASHEATVKEAADSCPVSVIKVS